LKNAHERIAAARASPLACSLRPWHAMMTTTNQSKRALSGAWLVVALLAVTLVAACAGRRETVVTTRTTQIEQRTLPAPKMVDISIVNLHDEPALDPSQEKVVGTIINTGDRRVSGLSIRVDALDAGGRVIRTVTTPPLAQPIDPNGGRATFEAFMARDETVAGYHAVAIAR
jgi:hypothetical protein